MYWDRKKRCYSRYKEQENPSWEDFVRYQVIDRSTCKSLYLEDILERPMFNEVTLTGYMFFTVVTGLSMTEEKPIKYSLNQIIF